MPLDTSIYALSHLRLDGRRWNELRRINAQISTQAAADGSSYLEMGNTKVICTVCGPAEVRGRGGGGAGGGGGAVIVDSFCAGCGLGLWANTLFLGRVGAPVVGGARGGGGPGEEAATVIVDICIAGFSSIDRKRRGKGDK